MIADREHVEIRNGGYYVAGTRVGLDIVAGEFQAGRSPEAILAAYPALGTLAKVYGAITFVLEFPAEIAAYLREQDRLSEEVRIDNPLPPAIAGKVSRLVQTTGPKQSH